MGNTLVKQKLIFDFLYSILLLGKFYLILLAIIFFDDNLIIFSDYFNIMPKVAYAIPHIKLK